MAFYKARALQEAEKWVAQGKTSQAIKLYLDIIERDPSDVSLLNTVGDLYIRERNVAEGIRQFHRLAEAYVHDGFNVKAIAIYRKIIKFDPNSVDTVLKLAELYQLQGLSREAREQYLQAADSFRKRKQVDRTLEALRKLVLLDPDNSNFRARLAAECEQTGRPEEAAQAYLESAESSIRRNDSASADVTLKKAAELDPKNPKIQLLRARMAIAQKQPGDALKILNSVPELLSDPLGRQLLLQSHLALHNLPEAEKLVMDVYRTSPSDFTPISGFVMLCMENGQVDSAYKSLAEVTDQLIERNNTGPLLESLRLIWNKEPGHIPTLELIYKVCERTADEFTLPEVLEALGNAYVQEGNLEKAEGIYEKLTRREPQNENYRGYLLQVMHKLGKEPPPAALAEFTVTEMALGLEAEAAPEPPLVDTEQEAMVKEAIENSDLFTRYNLVEKAIAELDKVLKVYPDQVDILQRLLDICRKGFPDRATAASAALARIYSEQGDEEMASKYRSHGHAQSSFPEVLPPPPPPPTPSLKPEGPVAPPPGLPKDKGPDQTAGFSVSPIASALPVETAPRPSGEAVFDLTSPKAPAEAPSQLPPRRVDQTMELDLSGDFEAIAGMASETAPPPVKEVPPTDQIPAVTMEFPAPHFTEEAAPSPAEENTSAPPQASAPLFADKASAPPEAPPSLPETPPEPTRTPAPFDIEDSWVEVNFYLENGFVDEARKAVAGLEEKYPGNDAVAELRRHVEERTCGAPTAEPATEVQEEAPAAPPEPAASPEPAPAETVEEPEPAPIVEEAALEEWEPPSTYAASPAPPPMEQPVTPPPAEPLGAKSAAAESGVTGLLGDMVGDFASTLDGQAGADAAASGTGPLRGGAGAHAGSSPQVPEQLSGLLAEMEGGAGAGAEQEDPETHYNLGTAFREMNLLDEAIGEFQKVVKGAGKGHFPTHYLQACSLLALCFMDKKMPAIAVKWYQKSLETPDLGDEAMLALQYDLGVAYEQAGDMRSALERFTEVYSQNIDFRDVAEKIRELQQKV